MSGIAEDVNENHILSYLREREIIPTYICTFRSKRRGSLSANQHSKGSMFVSRTIGFLAFACKLQTVET